MPRSRYMSAANRKKLNALLPESYAHYKELVAELEKMLTCRAETIEQMNSVAAELDKRHHSVNIAKLVGASAGVLGAAGATVGGVGLALIPFTGGLSALVAGVGGAMGVIAGGTALAVGSLTSAGAHFVEKLLENVDLAEVQRTVDRDRAQCDKVQSLWNEFENYSSDVVRTVELADLSEDPDLRSLKTWLLVAVRETKSKVSVVAEAFEAAYREITTSKGKNSPQVTTSAAQASDSFVEVEEATPCPEMLLASLMSSAAAIAGKCVEMRSVVSLVMGNVFVVGGIAVFLLIATIGVGNLFLLITTSIDMHRGSLSKVAKDIREISFKLEEEYMKWIDAIF